MSEVYDPITQECAACGALIDITDEEPLGLMHCPSCGVAMRVHRCFGNFEPVEVLGAGGMGAVYRAQDISLNRSVALKLLRREYSEHPEITRQFEHEAAVTAHINHPERGEGLLDRDGPRASFTSPWSWSTRGRSMT